MTRMSSVFVVVALLVLLVGCTDTTGSGADAGDAASPQSQQDPSTDDPDIVIVDQQPPVGGAADLDAVADAHAQGIADARSFTVTRETEARLVDENGSTLTITQSQYMEVDVWNNRALVVSAATSPGFSSVEEAYFSGTLTYVRVDGIPNAAPQRGIPVDWSDEGLAGLGGSQDIREMQTFTTYTEVGRETYNGASVARYEATAFDREQVLAELGGDTEITDISSTLLVGNDGVVRYLEFTLSLVEDGNVITAVVVQEWSDIGSTTVTEPAWVARARGN